MLHPRYKIQIGSSTFEPDSSDNVLGLLVDLSMDVPSNIFEGHFKIKKQGIGFTKGDPINVSIGYGGDEEGGRGAAGAMLDVFKGSVDTLQSRFSTVAVKGFSSMIKLCSKRIDRFYEQQTAGFVTKDLASTAGVSIEEVSDGIHFPYYAIDSNKNGYEHIIQLAHNCGFDAFMNNKDKLVFKKYQPNNQQTLEYGKNIIQVLKVEKKPLVESVKILAESPSSAKGSDTSHWLTKQQVHGIARAAAGGGGSGQGASSITNAIGLTSSAFSSSSSSDPNQVLIHNKSVRDDDTASRVAEAHLTRIKSSTLISLRVVGDPKIMLGNTVKIQKMPEDSLNGEYQVRTVEHLLSKSAGFTTILKVR